MHTIQSFAASHFVNGDLPAGAIAALIHLTTPATPLNDAHPGGLLL